MGDCINKINNDTHLENEEYKLVVCCSRMNASKEIKVQKISFPSNILPFFVDLDDTEACTLLVASKQKGCGGFCDSIAPIHGDFELGISLHISLNIFSSNEVD
jgi:hypothetical protein